MLPSFVVYHAKKPEKVNLRSGLSLSPSQGRGVTPVYLRCTQGHVTWSYPRGALRVLLRLPNGDRDFRGCIKVTPEFAGARLFVEGRRSLSPLFSLDDGAHKQLIRCFQSKKGQAAIYVEASNDSGDFKKEVAGFSYDLHPVPRGSSVSDLINEGCRPCSKREMAHAFCTNDLETYIKIQILQSNEPVVVVDDAFFHIGLFTSIRITKFQVQGWVANKLDINARLEKYVMININK
ncbi:hypothetical protein RUM43_004586 [Polyplax serrata]|uniref:Meteorin-like protein n=1 Tax=Polyplax serrata TaxID=468196 RepID=A0AAN8SB04_POLSC